MSFSGSFTFTHFAIPVASEVSGQLALAPEHVQAHVLLQLTPARPGALMGTPDDVRTENIVSTFLSCERRYPQMFFCCPFPPPQIGFESGCETLLIPVRFDV